MRIKQILAQRKDIWRGQDNPLPAIHYLPSGFAAIDQQLGGWASGCVIELLMPTDQQEQLSLLQPLMSRCTQAQDWVVWVAPPHLPYAPGLAHQGIDLNRLLIVHPKSVSDQLWAMDQLLRQRFCAVMLSWCRPIQTQHIRRLQLAAAQNQTTVFLIRDDAQATQASPAGFRFQVRRRGGQCLQLVTLKGRGISSHRPIMLESTHAVA